MRPRTLAFRLLGLLLLAALVSGTWLFRHQLLRAVRPGVARVGGSLGIGVGDGRASPEALLRGRDKVDSLHGWGTDSVVLDAGEMASLIAAGLPQEMRSRLDSIEVTLGEGQVTLSARLETTRIPSEVLGPLAGALEPWEPVSASGPVVALGPGKVGWQVAGLTLRGFTMSPLTTRRLLEQALPRATNGVLPVQLPRGVQSLRVRPGGVALYRRPPA